MNTLKFIGHINWRQVIIHFAASFFLIYGLYTFSHLYNTNWAKVIRDNNMEKGISFWGTEDISTLANFLIITKISALIGIAISLFLSLLISIKKKYSRINVAIVFVLLVIVLTMGSLYWTPVKNLFWFPGKLTENINIQLVINGLILLIISGFLFYSKYTRNIIEYTDSKE